MQVVCQMMKVVSTGEEKKSATRGDLTTLSSIDEHQIFGARPWENMLTFYCTKVEWLKTTLVDERLLVTPVLDKFTTGK